MKQMKKLIVMMMLVLPLAAMAQDLVNFVLKPDGTYQTEDGKDFIVVPFEGKTAHQIYQELATNVGSTYNDPSKVMSGVEDASIKIRAFSDDLIRAKPFGYVKDQSFGGFYQLEFRIKDGRVRVSAPIIEDRVEYRDIQGEYTYGNFYKYIEAYFKNGVLQDKKQKNYDIVVAKMNDIINSILHTSTVQDAQDDW